MKLLDAERILTFGPADYAEGSHTSRILERLVQERANRIVGDRTIALSQGVVPAAEHLTRKYYEQDSKLPHTDLPNESHRDGK